MDTKIKNIDFRNIKETEINAQEMSDSVFYRLVKNLKKDKVLTSAPLLMEEKNGGYRCISGHHGIKAAIKAGLTSADCIIIPFVDKSTRLRLQLSHNDIYGKSNNERLSMLYQELDENDLLLVEKVEQEEYENYENINYDPPKFSYVNIALLENSKESLDDLINTLSENESDKWIIEKEEYNDLVDLLTIAFRKGFKTPGRAFRKFLDIIEENKNQI